MAGGGGGIRSLGPLRHPLALAARMATHALHPGGCSAHPSVRTRGSLLVPAPWRPVAALSRPQARPLGNRRSQHARQVTASAAPAGATAAATAAASSPPSMFLLAAGAVAAWAAWTLLRFIRQVAIVLRAAAMHTICHGQVPLHCCAARSPVQTQLSSACRADADLTLLSKRAPPPDAWQGKVVWIIGASQVRRRQRARRGSGCRLRPAIGLINSFGLITPSLTRIPTAGPGRDAGQVLG